MNFKKGWRLGSDDSFEYRPCDCKDLFSYAAFIFKRDLEEELSPSITIMSDYPPTTRNGGQWNLEIHELFRDIKHPTKSELDLFEIEYGLPYLIKEDGTYNVNN